MSRDQHRTESHAYVQLADYVPNTQQTAGILGRLAELKPRTLAIVLRGLAVTMREPLGEPPHSGGSDGGLRHRSDGFQRQA